MCWLVIGSWLFLAWKLFMIVPMILELGLVGAHGFNSPPLNLHVCFLFECLEVHKELFHFC